MLTRGLQLLRNPNLNHGTCFKAVDRINHHLEALLPAKMESIEEQAQRTYQQIMKRPTNMDKFFYLNSVKNSNTNLFYRILIDHISDLAPIVYTPTVGDVCLNYSDNFIHSEGFYISRNHKGRIRQLLDTWPEKEIDIIVVSDGSRILGLGDLGLNGMGIPVGKLALYVSCAGFQPNKTLPIIIDEGTDNEENLKNPNYLGLKERRLPSEQYHEFMDEFMKAVTDKWKGVLVQHEDFQAPYCFNFLAKYREQYLMFNDDIQGTGAVILSGFINAHKLLGCKLSDQRLIFFGAGSAGTGVAEEIIKYFIKDGKMSDEEARSHFYLVDSKGLVTNNRGDKLLPHKVPLARKDNGNRQFKDLISTIEYVKPTALFGLSMQKNAFTEDVMKTMLKFTSRPIIFPLSNPTSKSECTFQQAINWTDGKVIFASGSPFDPVDYKGKHYIPDQGNNMYIFPGLGLGGRISGSKRISDLMIYSASRALADCTSREDMEQKGLLYPPLAEIRNITAQIALHVVKASLQENLCQNASFKGKSDNEILNMIKAEMYDPRY